MVRQHLPGDAVKIARHALELSLLGNGVEELGAKSRIPNCVMQNNFIGTGEPRDDPLRRGLRKVAGLFSRGDSNRQRVGLSRPIQVTDLNEPEAGGVRSVGQTWLRSNAHITHGARLRAEPAARLDIPRNNFAFEKYALPTLEERGKIGRRINHWNNALLARTAAIGL